LGVGTFLPVRHGIFFSDDGMAKGMDIRKLVCLEQLLPASGSADLSWLDQEVIPLFVSPWGNWLGLASCMCPSQSSPEGTPHDAMDVDTHQAELPQLQEEPHGQEELLEDAAEEPPLEDPNDVLEVPEQLLAEPELQEQQLQHLPVPLVSLETG
jgi:hypothetical protein